MLGLGVVASAVWLGGGTCFSVLESGFVDLWSMPGVFLMEGDSSCGLKARWEGRDAIAAPSASTPSGSMVAALAEKKPCPGGGKEATSSFEDEFLGRDGETGAEGGAEGGSLRLGWLRTLPTTGLGFGSCPGRD